MKVKKGTKNRKLEIYYREHKEEIDRDMERLERAWYRAKDKLESGNKSEIIE